MSIHLESRYALSKYGQQEYTPRDILRCLHAMNPLIRVPSSQAVWHIKVLNEYVCLVTVRDGSDTILYPNVTVQYYVDTVGTILETDVVHLEGVLPLKFTAALHEPLRVR